LITTEISNDDYQGTLGLIVPSSSSFKGLKLRTYFDPNSFNAITHTSFSEIEVSQKGVYINNYTSFFSYTVGKLNIKTKLNINLNRSGFRNTSDLDKILNSFEAQIIYHIYNNYLPNIKIRTPKQISEFTEWFINNYQIYGYSRFNSILKSSLKENFRFPIVDRNKKLYYKIAEIESKFEEIFLITEKDINVILDKSAIAYFQTQYNNEWIYESFFTGISNYGLCVDEINGLYITVMRRASYEEIEKAKIESYDLFQHYVEITIINNDKIAVDPLKNFLENRIDYLGSGSLKINIKHPLISGIIGSSEVLRRNSSSKKIVQEIFHAMYGLYNSSSPDVKIALKTINPLINRINLELGVNFSHLKESEL
jgi:hypothetical protein